MNMMAHIEAASDAISEPTAARLGEMLWSAIRYGGLLDERDWQRWVDGVRTRIAICGGLVSIELASDGTRPAGRWFADPITAVLIVRWHRDPAELPAGLDAHRCLSSFMEKRGGRPDRLAAVSKSAWAFRLPGLMLAYAVGDVPATSLPSSTWERIVYGPTVPDEPDDQGRAQRWRSGQQPNWLAQEILAVRSAARVATYSRGRRAALEGKAAAAAALERLPVTSITAKAAICRWAIHALRHDRGGRASIGYAPSTIASYMRALAVVLDGWSECPFACEAAALEAHVHTAMLALEARALANAVKALIAFQRFANGVRADAINFDLDDLDAGQPVLAEVVLPEAYSRVRATLTRAGEDDAAAIMVLMFRAGLRLSEVLGLRAGDVCAAAGRVELIVETNDERTLKTRTSRRILPLDVLLDDGELRDLMDRAAARNRASLADAEAWLFGPELAVSPPARSTVAPLLDQALTRAAGSRRVTHNHLRHSFASFLLSTLLLPQDVEHPDVPDRLASVISLARFRRVADRLLGDQRLGAGALHAVSQLMGHTGPQTTLRHYCHLLDLSLGLFCSRPSTLVPVDHDWLMDVLGVKTDARRKAGSRAAARLVPDDANEDHASRPSAAAILKATPHLGRKIADTHLIRSGVKRLARDLDRTLTAHVLEVEVPRRTAASPPLPAITVRPKPRRHSSYCVPWRRLLDEGAMPMTADTAPPTIELARFVDQRLRLARRPRRVEVEALENVVWRLLRRKSEIRLARLRDAEAFVRLLGVMGFAASEVHLSLTSRRGFGLSSADIHLFLADRSTLPRLAGRGGWRGSLIVRIRPAGQGLGGPIIVARAVRFALLALSTDLRATTLRR